MCIDIFMNIDYFQKIFLYFFFNPGPCEKLRCYVFMYCQFFFLCILHYLIIANKVCDSEKSRSNHELVETLLWSGWDWTVEGTKCSIFMFTLLPDENSSSVPIDAFDSLSSAISSLTLNAERTLRVRSEWREFVYSSTKGGSTPAVL